MNKKSIQLAVVLVNFNGFEDTKDCLESIVKNETISPYFILVDNSEPNDKSLDQLKSLPIELEILYADQNLGFGKANNFGIEWANEHLEYEYLLLLNNDTLIEPSAFTKMIGCFKADPSIGIVTCKTMYANNPDIVWFGGGSINIERGWPELVDYKALPTKDGANKSKAISFVAGCVVLFNRSSLDKLIGFDERLFMYVEDVELSLRANKEKIKMWYTADATILHRVQGSRSNENAFNGIHPKNKNVNFHFYHKFMNRWIVFRSALTGKELRTFKRNYWLSFGKTLTRLFVFSPKRFSVMKSAFKIVRSIITKNYEK